MIESILSIFALLGFGIGDGDKPHVGYQEPTQEIIRAIDSEALRGFDSLESHDAEQWFV